ncbi:MAG: S9 family peptidase [Planctomycetaceae bacterium]|nr:S9 family peptidase [Planctomycetaceae bacterium]
MIRQCLFWLALVIALPTCVAAKEPSPPQIEDLYATDIAADAITLADGRSAIYCRMRADAASRRVRQSLWRVDDSGPPRPLEAGEPDGFSPQLSPDGRWIVFHSTRPFADGTPAVSPVPLYSDVATDLWLLPVNGGPAVPLAGKSKPYGRVITDKFYGRVSFSPDGRRLAFVADEGLDPRSDDERRNDVRVVREDQGEGYEGYGPTHVWIADLLPTPGDVAAAKVTRVTPTDNAWYGDPQWSPDGSFIVVHANRTADRESVRFSVNRNFDLWKINLADQQITQLTTGPGPDFSPRIAPDGKRLVCLSSPRRGPHMDVFNLLVVDLDGPQPRSRVVYDHHEQEVDAPPSLPPMQPLPDRCWRDARKVAFSVARGVRVEPQCVDIDAGPMAIADPGAPPSVRSPLIPADSPELLTRLRASDEIVTWKSFDGQSIEGMLTLPPASIAARPYKLLVWPHGGPHSRTSLGSTFEAQVFAGQGFAVFQPNFRGSGGYGRKFLDADRNDYGGGDMRDILAGIDHLIEQGIVDRRRQFVYGTSYGGFMTTWLVGHTNQFRAAVAQNPVTDLNVMWHLGDLQSWTEWGMGGLPWEVAERMREHSPLTHVTKVQTPTLLLHALNDRRCPVAMSQMFHRALLKREVKTSLVLYPNEGHGIRQLPHREDVLRRVLAWFAAHDITSGDVSK